MIRIFIGYDHREAAAFGVLAHSIHLRASRPVTIAPLMLSQLRHVFDREIEPLQSTTFSFSRFLTPYLCDFEGWSLYMDCDMIMRDDVAKLWALRDDRHALMVVKHEHKPKETIKFLGAVQTKYEKKNWSSVMLFNNARCKALTPDYVNTASGLELHQFKWLDDDASIGALPGDWNHLVGYEAPDPQAKLVHYTQGGPYLDDYVDCEYSKEWFDERDDMLNITQKTLADVSTG